MSPDHHDATAYGRSFADVYDDWYPADDQTSAAVDEIAALASASSGTERGRVLELGVGSGRLAVPLAERGIDVSGIDASEEMLELLAAKAGASIRRINGDVSDPAAWPEGPFDVVVAAFNLICNLLDTGRQQRLFDLAANVLSTTGAFVVEVNEPVDSPGPARLDVRHVTQDSVVLIATDVDERSGVVTGQHIELRDGEAPKLRPWRVRLTALDELDAWADAAGMQLERRSAGWDGEGHSVVSSYRRR